MSPVRCTIKSHAIRPVEVPSQSARAVFPSQFAKAYNYNGLHNAGLQGEGQTVGVFELDGYSLDDVKAYTQCFGGGNVPIQNVIVDGFNGQPGAGAVAMVLSALRRTCVNSELFARARSVGIVEMCRRPGFS